MASNLQAQFHRGAVPTFLWFVLYGLLWWPYVSGGDVGPLFVGVILAVIILWRHAGDWLVVVAGVVIGAVLTLLGIGLPLEALPWLLAGAWLL